MAGGRPVGFVRDRLVAATKTPSAAAKAANSFRSGRSRRFRRVASGRVVRSRPGWGGQQRGLGLPGRRVPSLHSPCQERWAATATSAPFQRGAGSTGRCLTSTGGRSFPHRRGRNPDSVSAIPPSSTSASRHAGQLLTMPSAAGDGRPRGPGAPRQLGLVHRRLKRIAGIASVFC